MRQVAFLNMDESSEIHASKPRGFEQVCEGSLYQVGPLASQSLSMRSPAACSIGVERAACLLVTVPESPLFRVSLGEIGGDLLFAVEFNDKIRIVISFVRHDPQRSSVFRYGSQILPGGIQRVSKGPGIALIRRCYAPATMMALFKSTAFSAL